MMTQSHKYQFNISSNASYYRVSTECARKTQALVCFADFSLTEWTVSH